MVEQPLLSVSEMPELADWRRLVEPQLKGRDFASLQSRTRDGIVIEPLYAGRIDTALLSGRGGRRWLVVQSVDNPDPDLAAEQAQKDLRGGATGLALRFAEPACPGLPPTEEALRSALEGIDVATVHLRLEPHPSAHELAGWLRALIARRGIAPERMDVSFGLDPVATAVSPATDPAASDALVASFIDLHRAGFRRGLATLDARSVHEAGGTETQEIAAILAAAAWWLRALDARGIDAAAVLPTFCAALAVDRDQFLSIAKLRAVRLCFARLEELCGTKPSHLWLHAETSRRMMTRADPHTNLLRTTIAAFSAGIGGADSVMVHPFTEALGVADGHARALARNIQHLLLEESNLHRVADPAAGSGAVEALTDALAERAWNEFQAIEHEGGLVESLRSGSLSSRIFEARQALAREIESGAAPLVGATTHRDPAEPGLADQPSTDVVPAAGLTPIRLEALAGAAA